jgi:hypothetical protein
MLIGINLSLLKAGGAGTSDSLNRGAVLKSCADALLANSINPSHASLLSTMSFF